MTRSFRDLLAVRFALITAGGMALCAVATFFILRHILDAELRSNLLNVASIQAAALADDAGGEMHFHEWDLTPEDAAAVQELVRYAEVWSAGGESLLRSRYMTDNLPMDLEALLVASGGELVWRESTFQGTPIRSVYYPLARLGEAHTHHVLQVAAPLGTRNAMLWRVVVFGVILVLLTGVGSFLGGRWLANHAIRPVHQIIREADFLGAGALGERITAHADTEEYQRLVEVLNTMLDRVQATVDSQRRFTADASHELRSPLTAMRGELELALRRERGVEEYRAVIESAREETIRLGRIVEGLLTLARSDAGAIQLRRVDSDLRTLVEEAVARTTVNGKPEGAQVEVLAPDPVPGAFDPELVVQMASNLIQNGVRFAGKDGRVLISVHTRESVGVLRVEDSGPGIERGHERRVFDPFWRADPSRARGPEGEGLGLGLAIVRAIAAAHQGTAVASSSAELGGARIEVVLPLIDPQAAEHLQSSMKKS